jgi:hypothetical protein
MVPKSVLLPRRGEDSQSQLSDSPAPAQFLRLETREPAGHPRGKAFSIGIAGWVCCSRARKGFAVALSDLLDLTERCRKCAPLGSISSKIGRKAETARLTRGAQFSIQPSITGADSGVSRMAVSMSDPLQARCQAQSS